jgi:GH24 family phage-related lysozyme (muramidase)
MHAAVRDVWVDFNSDLEGVLNKMYADIKNLITIGMGVLIDPMSEALKLDFDMPDGSKATRDQIQAAWLAIKLDPMSATRGWKYAFALPANLPRLSDAAVKKLTFKKLDANDASMKARFADWEDRPADAQLAIHSMAWAMGPGFFTKFPRFTKHFLAGDYQAAAGECFISPAKGTVVERNRRNHGLLMAASLVGGDPSEVTVSWAGRTPTIRPPAA